MKLILTLMSLWLGTTAMLKTVELMNAATSVMGQAFTQ